MMHIPDESEVAHLPGGLNEYLSVMKNQSCVGCHQLGQLSTRTFPEEFQHIESSEQRWIRRVQSGQAARNMIEPLASRLAGVPFKYLADWTDRVAAGETPRLDSRTAAGHRAQHRRHRAGTGRTRSPTCTTCRRPIEGIPR